MGKQTIPKATLTRLPLYLNYLKSLPEEDNATISAAALGRILGLNGVLVRKDLAKVSCRAMPKVGRNRTVLIRDLEQYLSRNCPINAVVVGAGRIGQALLDHTAFNACGMNLLAGFDIVPRTGNKKGKPIYPMERLADFCNANHVRIGIITVPPEYAQEACNKLINCNMEAIWNFSPTPLCVPEHIVLKQENLASSAASLCMELNNRIM